MIVILNFSAVSWNNYYLELENGEYEIILDSEDLAYGGFSYRTNKKYNITDGHVFIDLLPCSALILKKINC